MQVTPPRRTAGQHRADG